MLWGGDLVNKLWGVFAIILLLPSASAAELIYPQPDPLGIWKSINTFPNKADETYDFSIPNPPFNYSAAYGANDSINLMQLTAKFIDNPTIDKSTSYYVLFSWNNTETLKIGFDYTKSGWGYFAVWRLLVTVERNGVFLCNNEDGATGEGQTSALGNSISPSISATMILRPRAINNGENGNNISDTITYFATDGLFVGPNTQPNLVCDNPAVGDNYFNATSIISPPGINVAALDGKTYSHEIQSYFANVTMTDPYYDNATGLPGGRAALGLPYERGAGLFPGCDGGFLLSLFCITGDILFGLVKFLLVGLDKIVGLIFGLFPYGLEIKKALLFPIDAGIKILLFIGNVYFNSGPNYAPGGTWLALLSWSVCLGAGVAALVLDLQWIWKIPWYFIYGSTVGIVLAFYWIYWKIPTTAFTYILESARAIRG